MKFFFLPFLIVFVTGCGCYETERYLQLNVKPKYYKGQIQHKYVDSSDRMTPKIVFIDGSEINLDVYEMYDILQNGDSIIKDSGSLKHLLISRGKLTEFYPRCNGNEIK